jgi:dehypoxanthine futalosine cyclase
MLQQCIERISPEEALDLLTKADTAELIAKADKVRRQKHAANVYHVHSLNLNPTNVCENRCGLCAFWREPGSNEAYTLSLPQAQDKLVAAKGWGLTDVHIVGGLSRELDLDYYLELLRITRRVLPETAAQALTAVEVRWLSDRAGKSVAEVLAALKAAGLDALPGGGAEIFSARVRDKICPRKISAEQWLCVHQRAHSLGIPSNATMLFGHVETPEEIVDHLCRLRGLQDQTNGFQAFCPLPFHARSTQIGVATGSALGPEGRCASGLRGRPGGHTIVRIVALARIFLDNFPHIRILANFLDRKLLQTLLFCGADDIGGTSIDERIARSAGASDDCSFHNPEEMATFIRELGFDPVLTSSLYDHQTRTRPQTDVPLPASKAARALQKAEDGQRLNAEEATWLHDDLPFYELGRIAHQRRGQVVGDQQATFILDRNISFTNICAVGCRFCAYHRGPTQGDAFTMSMEEIVNRVEEAAGLGATQIMLQGGLNPALSFSWYKDMLRAIKDRVPAIWLHSLSPAEVLWLAQRSHLTLGETLVQLREAGLDSLPGGGAEILVDAVRRRVSPAKITTAQWLEVMETAHRLGMSTTATMVYGLGETTADRVQHLLRIRNLQDRTGGFRAFIPWSFQSNRTRLRAKPQSGVDYLRMVALSRLVLDNVAHIQAGWVTEGPDMAQIALTFGADDFGGVLMEESVVKATGVRHAVTAEQVIALIVETGMIAAQRNTEYQILRPTRSPDAQRPFEPGAGAHSTDKGPSKARDTAHDSP